MALGQLGKREGLIAEANSEAIDLSTIKAKADIMDDVKASLDDLELGHAAKRLRRCLRRTTKPLKSA